MSEVAEKRQTRKELLKSQDEFITLSTRVILFARAHSTHFTYIGAVVAVIVLIYLGFNSYNNYIDRRGQEVYNTAYYALLKNQGNDDGQDKYSLSEEYFLKVINDYSSTKVGKLALSELAYIRFRDKNYDEAISFYDQFLNKLKNKPSYQSLARMALAACYEEKGESQRAIEILEELYHNPDNFVAQHAMLDLARLYRHTNQQEKAVNILREFVEKYEGSPLLPLAQAYLNRLS
jgi:tetratricopeptide (TPR) repeat protein